jgi:hypothetical protein
LFWVTVRFIGLSHEIAALHAGASAGLCAVPGLSGMV